MIPRGFVTVKIRVSAGMTEKSLTGVADRATDSDAFEYTARAGFAVSGVLHLLIGYLIVRIALGSGSAGQSGSGQSGADQSGALATLGQQTGGAILLWAVAVGLAALGLWRVAEAIVGAKPGEGAGTHRDDTPAWKRGKSIALALVNFSIALSAVRYATGSGQQSSEQNAGLSAQMMSSGWGKAVLIAVGLGVIGVGGYHVYKGVTQRFFKDLRVGPHTEHGTAITALGVVGYTAKGLALAGAGVLVIVATLQADPAKATGLDAAVKTLGQAPFGRILLLFAAAGIAAFGAYSFVRARHGRM